jgi:hypothetical protein
MSRASAQLTEIIYLFLTESTEEAEVGGEEVVRTGQNPTLPFLLCLRVLWAIREK